MTDVELDRIVTLKRAAELMGCHVDTVRRNYRHKFVWLSERRCGLRLRDALRLDSPGKRPVSQSGADSSNLVHIGPDQRKR